MAEYLAGNDGAALPEDDDEIDDTADYGDDEEGDGGDDEEPAPPAILKGGLSTAADGEKVRGRTGGWNEATAKALYLLLTQHDTT